MKIKLIAVLILFILFSGFSVANNTTLSGSAEISLLTEFPGKEVWSQYGHTGIRVKDPDKKIDITFNYGMFDFRTKNFILRFVEGKTDYSVCNTPTSYFLNEVKRENRQYAEQKLNLTAEEKNRLWGHLLDNIKPENRLYRYNFLFDNCATRPRNIIEKSIDGEIINNIPIEKTTFRKIIHKYTKYYPWTQFGIDIVIGSGADSIIGISSQQFCPVILMASYKNAYIIRKNDTVPLVAENNIPEYKKPQMSDSKLQPETVFTILLILTTMLSIFEIKKRKNIYTVTFVMYLVTGLAGTIIFFLMFFSIHPVVNPNYNIIWLNPINIIYAIAILIPGLRKKANTFFPVIFTVLQLFSLAGIFFLPQKINISLTLLLITMIIRSLTTIYNRKR